MTKEKAMKTKQMMFRQGDVLVVLTAVASLPAGAKEIRPDPSRGIVLALGEVTGHAHAISVAKSKKPPVKYFDANAERYLQVLEKVTLKHEEHGAILLNEGIYRQAFQVEDFGEEVRHVAD